MIGIHVTNGMRVGIFEGVDKTVDWTDAACVGMEPSVWDGDYPELDSIAKDICSGCPIREICLQRAMDREGAKRGENRFGIWGGLDPYERSSIYRNARTP